VDQWVFLVWIFIGWVAGWVMGRAEQAQMRRALLPEPITALSDLPEDDFDELNHQQRADLVEVRTDLARCAAYLQGLVRGLLDQRTGYVEPEWRRGPSELERAIRDAASRIQGAVDTLKLPVTVESRATGEKPPLDRLQARSEFQRYEFDPATNLHVVSVKMPLPNGSWTLKTDVGVDVDAVALRLLKELDQAEAARRGGPEH
jgi:hypothetical protein